jgi:long-chain acyl-CoA synthetase
VSNIKAAREMGGSPSDFPSSRDRSLAFLPWAHSYGQVRHVNPYLQLLYSPKLISNVVCITQTCELWCLMSQGASMGICRGIPHILDDLQMVKPTILFAVPTLYKKVHDGVINAMQNVSPIQRSLMRSALRLGKINAAHRNGIVDENGIVSPPLGFIDGFQHRLLDGIVLSKIRYRFGGRLRAGFVAGAACPKEIVDFMDAVGIPICEGYGELLYSLTVSQLSVHCPSFVEC